MSKSEIKECEICKIFGNPCRISILLQLRTKPQTVSSLIEKTGLAQSVVSQHLSILRNKGIVHTNKEGAWIMYSLVYPEIMNAFDIMRNVAKKIR